MLITREKYEAALRRERKRGRREAEKEISDSIRIDRMERSLHDVISRVEKRLSKRLETVENSREAVLECTEAGMPANCE